MKIYLDAARMPRGYPVLTDEALLFSESNSRFVVEVRDETRFKKIMKGVPVWKIGYTTKSGSFIIRGVRHNKIISTDIDDLRAAWRKPFEKL